MISTRPTLAHFDMELETATRHLEPAIRVDRIKALDLVRLRVKDRVLYGEVLEVADGIVRFRPLSPRCWLAPRNSPASRRALAQSATRTRNKTTSQAQQPSPSPQPLPSPKPETSPTTPGTRPVTADFSVKQERGSWLAHPHEQTTLRGRLSRTRSTVLRGSAAE